jgi:hypothetical protein
MITARRFAWTALLLQACLGSWGTLRDDEVDDDNDGYTRDVDCDDAYAGTHPTAAEVADGRDNDCNAAIDEGTVLVDDDGDGFCESEDLPCSDGAERGDCDDTKRDVRPGAVDLPGDTQDQDCDGSLSCYLDADRDGFGSRDVAFALTCDGDGVSAVNNDCDDTNPARRPDGVEVTADGVDSDCDGYEACFVDQDRDGYAGEMMGPSENPECTAFGTGPAPTDCDDADAATYPGAVEVPGDEVDEDCNGRELCYVDADQDGFGGPTLNDVLSCAAAGFAALGNDCDDSRGWVYPGVATEAPADGVDADCDGLEACWCDQDGDGWGNSQLVASAHLDCLGAGVGALEVCADGMASVAPVAGDCDDQSSDVTGVQSTWYQDIDRDGYGSFAVAQTRCVAPGAGWVLEGGDCADDDPSRRPGIGEDCAPASTDDDCDGLIDDEDLDLAEARDALLVWLDQDGDAYGAGEALVACAVRAGLVGNSRDCDDGNPHIRPGVGESCDGVDQNCDGAVDEGNDRDEDGWTWCGGDCDDYDTRVFPGGALSLNCDDSVVSNYSWSLAGRNQPLPGPEEPRILVLNSILGSSALFDMQFPDITAHQIDLPFRVGAYLGDVDGDSIPDFDRLQGSNVQDLAIVSIDPISGYFEWFEYTYADYGCPLGDVNGDSVGDFVLDQMVYHSSPSGPVRVAENIRGMGGFDSDHLSCGDADGDGSTDITDGRHIFDFSGVLTFERSASVGGFSESRSFWPGRGTFLLLPQFRDPSTSYSAFVVPTLTFSDAQDDALASLVELAGRTARGGVLADLDCDGFDDAFLSTYDQDGASAVSVYWGPLIGEVQPALEIVVGGGANAEPQTPMTADFVGDLDGDGCQELAITAGSWLYFLPGSPDHWH